MQEHVRQLFGLFALSLVLVSLPAKAAVTAAATLERCVGLEQDSSEPPGCIRKLVVDVTVDGRQVAGNADDWRTTLSFANDTTVFSSATGPEIANVSFPPLSLVANLSATQQRYPLTYVREFSSSLYIEEAWGGSMTQCDNGGNACGPYTRVDGTPVPISNGLCCVCAQCIVFDCTGMQLENLCHSYSFGSLCLRSSTEKYAGYLLGPLSLWFTLGFTMDGAGLQSSTPTGDGNGIQFFLDANVTQTTVDVLTNDTLSTSPVTALLREASVGAAGDSQDNFSGFVLFTPTSPTSDSRASAGSAEWMLLPPSRVTLDGSECDKVGVSQETWDAQSPSQCMEPRGTCRGNQLSDLRAADADRVAIGQNPLYMIDSLGTFRHEEEPAAPGGPTLDWLLGVTQATPTILTRFVMSADTLDTALVAAPGDLSDVVAPDTPNGVTVNDLTVKVHNTGTTGSRFYLSLTNCMPGVEVVTPTYNLLLGAQQSIAVQFTVTYPLLDVSMTLGCTFTLQDADGVTIVERVALWTGSAPGAPGGGSAAAQQQREKCAACGIADFQCIWPNACLRQTLVWFLLFEVTCTALWWAVHLCGGYSDKRWYRRPHQKEDVEKKNA